MKKMVMKSWGFAGAVLALLGLVGLVYLAVDVDAAGNILCVNPGGTGGCYASVQAAIDAAVDGDTIRVVQGTYYETLDLNKGVTLEGGWNAGLSERDWDLYVTTLDAQRNGSVIQVHGTLSPTIEGFVITGGDGSAYLGWGGGIEVYGDVVNGGGTVIIRHNVITDNIACRDSACQGQGGGVRVGISTAIIEANTVVSNVARLSGDGGGTGGGVMIGWGATAVLSGNAILSNTAVYTPTGIAEGTGGGVYLYSYSGDLVGNEIRGNVAAVGGPGGGGGVYAGGSLRGNRILNNTASVNSDGTGGGVYAKQVTLFEDNLVQGNVASQNSDGSGGGIYGYYFTGARHNTIIDNVATRGGGLYYTSYLSNLTLRENLIAHNQATGTASDPPDGGGGIASVADWVEMTDNQIFSNTAKGAGGGALIWGGSRYVFEGNQVVSNTAVAGGGLAVFTSTGGISYNQVISNLALVGGGLYVWGGAQPRLDSNVVMSNTALGFYAAGGGILVNVHDGLPLTLTNHIIARNAAGSGGPGGGVLCWRGDCVLIHNTIVDNDRGDHKEGVYLTGGGSHTLWSNIIVGHSTGVHLANGAAAVDYNGYFDNDTDLSGVAWGPHHVSGAPAFQDRTGGDYHLTIASPFVDQADDSVAPNHDFEGDPRPRGASSDIGADELYPDKVYVSAYQGDDLGGTGTMAHPFASVTRGLAEVRSGGTVYVARGHYTECVTLTRSVDLLGGYHEDDWSRDITAYTATLDAAGTGTVVVIDGERGDFVVEGFCITGGEAKPPGLGGGLLVDEARSVVIRANTIHHNHALATGGGLFANEGMVLLVEANRFHDNVAEGQLSPLGNVGLQSIAQGPLVGGGLAIFGEAEIVNNLVYSNTNRVGGDGLALFDLEGMARLWHNTVADNGGTDGEGLWLGSTNVELYNNLIVGHGTAISGTQAAWDYTGFDDNAANYAAGLSAGAHDVVGDPRFADRAAFDYHLGAGSAMAGQGLDVGVTVDLDGAPRPEPAATAPDLGAYEVGIVTLRTYLPLVMKH